MERSDADVPQRLDGPAVVPIRPRESVCEIPPELVTLAQGSRAASPRIPAVAFCQGTPLRNEIEARDATRLGEATDAAEREITRRFGSGPIDAKMQAHIVSVLA